MAIQWSLPPQPEFFDHQIDLFYWWLASRNSLWLERGVFGSLALQGGGVLEIACGDGFNARNFYSLRSERVVACDFDPKAIKTAQGKNSAPNIEFLLVDIRTEMPEGEFENIIWDAAIEHFTPDEIAKILNGIKSRLTDDGILSGYTIVERADCTKSLSHHEYEFKSKEDLLRFFQPHFRNVTVFETEYPERHNLYFWASDGVLPFGLGWSKAVTFQR
jgi:SAM-dependent methyltransferase